MDINLHYVYKYISLNKPHVIMTTNQQTKRISFSCLDASYKFC